MPGFQENGILLLSFVIALSLINNVSCGKAKDYRIELKSFKNYAHKDYNYAVVHMARLAKFNRTTTVLNGSATILQEINNIAKGKLTCYEKIQEGKYSQIPMPVVAPTNVCEFIEKDTLWYPMILKYCPNCPKKCPITAGDYQIINLVVESDQLPERLPGNYWRCDVAITEGRVERFKLSAFIFINRKI